MKKLRRLTEAEVIAEFLRNEFHERDYDRDRAMFDKVVRSPDLNDHTENALRRALLFRRRGHMWRELPADTQWWELELDPADLARVRVFPRAQWSRIARGSYYLADIAKQLRERGARLERREQRMAAKLRGIGAALSTERSRSTVLLVGVDERRPLLILEGNHRLTAALLRSPALAARHFRVVCGFSPRMTRNCWYRTDLPNLWRYAKNRLRNLVDREADVYRVLESAKPPRALHEGAGVPAFTQKAETK